MNIFKSLIKYTNTTIKRMTETHKMQSVFTSNGKHYIFESDSFESRETFNKRAWFIIKYLEDNKLTNCNEEKFHEVIMLSRIWINEQTLDAKY